MKDNKTRLLSLLMHGAIALMLLVLLAVIGYVFLMGLGEMKVSLFSLHYNSDNVSMFPAILNTVLVTVLTLVVAVPVSVGAAIYLSEYTKDGLLVKVMRMTADTLSGIPSIVFGLFGYLFFVSFLGWGYSVLSGSMTLFLMVLPILIRTSEVAIRGIPEGLRESSLALGAGKLRTIMGVVLPTAMPGIMSGIILGMGRILGETAALMYTAGTAANVASSLLSSGRTLSVHMYALMSEGLHMEEARATAVVLLALALGLNGLSKWMTLKKGGNHA